MNKNVNTRNYPAGTRKVVRLWYKERDNKTKHSPGDQENPNDPASVCAYACAYVHMCMCVCMCVCLCECTHVSVCVHEHVYVLNGKTAGDPGEVVRGSNPLVCHANS